MKYDKLFAVSSLVLLLAACGGDDSSPRVIPPPAEGLGNALFEVTTLNGTSNQPLSPIFAVTSRVQNQVFKLGSVASVELEHLAEGGDVAPLTTMNRADPNVDLVQSSPSALASGESATMNIMVSKPDAKYLTVASMLINTNDGFIAEEIDLSKIAVGERRIISAPIWDSGTEANTETLATIPGPASNGTGQGFNPARNSLVNFVTTHQGVMSSHDLPTSELNTTYRILNPGARIIISRVR